MYSRNLDMNEINNFRKNNLETRKMTPLSVSSQKGIPVRSFTDNFAYERFNKIGSEIHSKNDEIIMEKTAGEITSEKNDKEESVLVAVSEKTEIDGNENNTEEKKFTIKDIIKLDKLYDSDIIFLALAAAITIFGNKENNDKLTPIALLAIIFL